MFGESEDNQPDTTAVQEEKTETVDVEAETAEPTAEEVAAAEQVAKEEQEKAHTEADKKADDEEATLKAAEEKRKEDFSLSGSGQQASSKFTLEDSFVVIKFTHDGQSNYAVQANDSVLLVTKLVHMRDRKFNESMMQELTSSILRPMATGRLVLSN